MRKYFVLILFCLAYPACDEPGKGPKAEKGYSACAPIIDAIDKHKEKSGEYPSSLEKLVPIYLKRYESRVNDYPIKYEQKGSSYVLRFSYEGPGMNHCLYTPETKWKCSGYY